MDKDIDIDKDKIINGCDSEKVQEYEKCITFLLDYLADLQTAFNNFLIFVNRPDVKPLFMQHFDDKDKDKVQRILSILNKLRH